jgi:uncharacterized Zn-binding protein involved in type VI secretion
MPAVAKGSGQSVVFSKTGSGKDCKFPTITSTGECSVKVFFEGFGAVRKNDKVSPHQKGGCTLDDSGLTTYSNKVFVEGRNLGRIGDKYTDDNTIISGSAIVFAG